MDDQALELARLAASVRDDGGVFGTLSTGEQLFVALLPGAAEALRGM